MPLTASPDDQARLLDVQAIDTKLQQLAHRSRSLPQLATIAELETQRESLRLGLVEETGTLEDARLELQRVESDVELVETRIARDTERLESTSSVKDVTGLETELASLRKRQSDLEDIQLAVMERIEELEAAVATTTARDEELAAQVTAAAAERDEALAEIDRERETATVERASLVGTLPAELVALYERQRERYGAGASLLRGGVSSASGVALNESDMAAIRAAAPDEVVLCPDSNAILVRTAESGL